MERIVVVGASLAGLRASESLRREGFEGQLVLLGEEPHAPYDRPPLSKEVLRGEWEPAQIRLQPADLSALGIELRTGVAARALDLSTRSLGLSDGSQLHFDGLVIATGSTPRRLPGQEALEGVFCLRGLDDALALRQALGEATRVVVIGAGFIGAEVAAAARALDLPVTICEGLPVPLAPRLGERMGGLLGQLQTDHGVDLRCGVQVDGLEGDRRVTGVRLADGTRIAADLVVVGIGVRPATRWLESSGLDLEDGVRCDASCAASHEGVVAAGDVARWYNPLFERHMRIEHWTHAVEQAEHAARTLLAGREEAEPFESAPLFWSDQYGIKIQFAGDARPDDALHICHGQPEDRRFVALYERAGRLVGALAFARPAQLIRYRQKIQARMSIQDSLPS